VRHNNLGGARAGRGPLELRYGGVGSAEGVPLDVLRVMGGTYQPAINGLTGGQGHHFAASVN
ncbi:unnamed protein product, partial [Effrenium voratum]